MGPRPGKRGRPPKQPVQTKDEGQTEVAAEPEPAAVENVPKEEELSTENAAVEAAKPEDETTQAQPPAENAAEGEHVCSDCGMSFQRRYALIKHALKHEKARGYKCSVSVHQTPSFSLKV